MFTKPKPNSCEGRNSQNRHVLDHTSSHPAESPLLHWRGADEQQCWPQPGHSMEKTVCVLVTLSLLLSSLFSHFQKSMARQDHGAAKGCSRQMSRRQAAGCSQCICSLLQDLHLTSIFPLSRHLYLSFQETSDDSSIGTSDEVNVISKINST